MGQIPEHRRGYQDGIRAAVTWLHARAREMNDPKARAILDCAADHLGTDHALGRMTPPPPSAPASLSEG